MKFTEPLLKFKNKIKKLQYIDESIVTSLYSVSQKSMLFALMYVIFASIVLYPVCSYKILIWTVFITIVLFFRLYMSYIFKHHFFKYKLEKWYSLFIVSSLLTASVISLLSIVYIKNIEDIYQLFIVIGLIGFSAGASTSLYSDMRLSVVYISIIMFPLIITLLVVEIPFSYILSFLAILYYLNQIIIIYNSCMQKNKIEKLEDEKIVLDNLFKHVPLSMFMYDADLNIIECNEQFLKMFDNTRKEMIGFNLNNIADAKLLSSFKKALSENSQTYIGQYFSMKGKKFWVEAKIFPYENKFDNPKGCIVLIEDKSKEKSIEKDFEYLSNHDPLTGLRNRRGLRNVMEQMIDDDKHNTYYSLLFYVDLNHFKDINDSLGHSIGDKVLLNISKRLKFTLGEVSHISRQGGDEFILLIPFVSIDKVASQNIANSYVKQIQHIFSEPFVLDELHLHIKASMGIVIIEPKYGNIEELIRHADISMYHAKNVNNNIAYYNVQYDKKQKELFSLQHHLAYAVEKNQFEIYFQPIVKMLDDTLYSAEALIRWNHPEKGLLGPDTFISLAIRAGLLSKITWWVLDAVCKQILAWKKMGLWKLEYVSININARQLIEKNFADTFLLRLENYGLSTKDIMIEITERSLIDNFKSTQDVISILKNHGIRCAIDDFGVGYSSLSYLKKLSFHTLKIDREFIKTIDSNSNELSLISTILDIGRQFNYTIIIEGIEDKKQKELLLGLDEGLNYQGFYFSKPLTEHDFTERYLSPVS